MKDFLEQLEQRGVETIDDRKKVTTEAVLLFINKPDSILDESQGLVMLKVKGR